VFTFASIYLYRQQSFRPSSVCVTMKSCYRLMVTRVVDVAQCRVLRSNGQGFFLKLVRQQVQLWTPASLRSHGKTFPTFPTSARSSHEAGSSSSFPKQTWSWVHLSTSSNSELSDYFDSLSRTCSTFNNWITSTLIPRTNLPHSYNCNNVGNRRRRE